jgi:Xylose isomerase-like TIM barrel
MSPKRLLVVNVPSGMGGPDEPGWRTAATRPSSTDYWVRGGGVLGAETNSFASKLATGELTVASIPAWYRKIGLPHMAINSRHITSWDNASLDRIREAVREQDRTVAAVLIDDPLRLEHQAPDARQVEEFTRIMRGADYLGAPIVRVTLGPADASVIVERASAALRQLLPVARELGVKMAIAPARGSSLPAPSILRIVNDVDPAVVGVALELQGGEQRTMTEADVIQLAPFVTYLRVQARAFDKYGEETTIDYGDALEAFEKAAYRGTISIAFEGDTDPVTGVIKTRDLLVKEWVASAATR